MAQEFKEENDEYSSKSSPLPQPGLHPSETVPVEEHPAAENLASHQSTLAGIDAKIANANNPQEALDYSLVRATLVRQIEYEKQQDHQRNIDRHNQRIESTKLRAKYASGTLSFATGVGLIILYALHPVIGAMVQGLGGFLIGGGLWVTIPDYVKWWHTKEGKDDDTS